MNLEEEKNISEGNLEVNDPVEIKLLDHKDLSTLLGKIYYVII